MRALALLLTLIASSLSAQQQAESTAAEQMLLRVHAVEASTDVVMRIATRGRLSQSLGIDAKAGGGTIAIGPHGGTAKGVVIGELASDAGEITFSTSLTGPDLELTVYRASGDRIPRLYARGRNVRVVRSAEGRLHVEAGWLLP